ncbi:MAG TPA: c-type cytochrome [Methylophilaceae bacterium]|nr:c-type cytochrome [Methylophilaceae bacterium]
MGAQTQINRREHGRLAKALACLLLSYALPALAGNSTKPPAPKQLLGVEVGQTRVPNTAQPVKLKNPYEGDPKAVAQGQTLYSAMNCIGCHAPEGGGGMGPPLSDDAWIYGSDPGQVYLSIVQGRPNGMPSFSKALPPEAIWQLVSYVRSLASDSPGQPVKDLPKSKQTDK